jgi:hypothetical protein
VATQLKNIIAFTGVAAGATETLAHELNVDDLGVTPDKIQLDNGNFTYISADATSITVRNDDTVPASVNVLAEHWHTIDRCFGASAVTELNPQPFVPAAGSTSGGVERFAPPEKWQQPNVAAGQTDVDLGALLSVNYDTIKMIRAGSIVGLSTRFTEAITDANAGSAVVTVTVNGVAGALSLSHSSGSNPNGGEAIQAAGTDTFTAGDLVGIQITTLGTFAPTTTDLEAWLDMEF